MIKKTLQTAMAFVGIVVGAGFATGQEVLQYFVSFGKIGIVGAAISGLIMVLTGLAAIQLGSYFLANDHGAVLRRISHPIVAVILDISVLITLFCTGFVMFAGAGSNMQQQFGWPLWAGALMMLILVLVAGLLNVDKVSSVIGAITPLIIVFVLLAVFYAIATANYSEETLQIAATNVESPTPNWLLSAVNYVGLALMVGVSMSIVVGGNNVDPRSAGFGGLLGGLIYGVLMVLITVGLYLDSPNVAQDDVPMLSIVDSINPVLGTCMAVVIVAMIFNTAIAMFYAFGKRLTSSRFHLFYRVFAVACIIGFGFSFLGFRRLVNVVYPILGYMGILLIVVLSGAWILSFRRIREEQQRREKMHVLLRRKLDPTQRFSSKQERLLERYAEESNIDTEQLEQVISEEVDQELSEDNLTEESNAENSATEQDSDSGAEQSKREANTNSNTRTETGSVQEEFRPLTAGEELSLPEHAQPKNLEDLSQLPSSDSQQQEPRS